ncbi:MAG: DUF2867 domain-containing protein, partial [Parvularculaceae bacterium]|nr:DUF2867 domain-containing protein [Parvularculaceae bacterium]
MRDRKSRARLSRLPSSSKLESFLTKHSYLDTYEVTAAGVEQPIMKAYASVLGRMPRYFRFLMYLRTILVAPFGLKGP